MKFFVHEDHNALQLNFKNHSSITMLQLHPPKCNSYATPLHKYNDFFHVIKQASYLLVAW
jgi:hypothetical protein